MPRPRLPERILRHVWHRLLFVSDGLVTTDGAPVAVLFPGEHNTDGGPDFRDARVRIGGIVYCGDIELHVDGASWHAHRHADDPHYNRVILHVVVSADASTPPAITASGRRIPLLVLQPFIADALPLAAAASSPEVPPLPCSPYNMGVPEHLIRSWLHDLCRERLAHRINLLQERMAELIRDGEAPCPERPAPAAWEQLLYEVLLEAMGYRKNASSFRALAQSVRLDILKRFGLHDTPVMQAILLGAAGLLPRPYTLADRESRAAARALRRRWKSIRPSLRIPLLHEADWLFFRLRPSNFPTARIAAFAFCLPLLFGPGSLSAVIALFEAEPPSPRALRAGLAALFRCTPDSYWSRHRHFRGTGAGNGVAIGRERIADCLVNAFIPFAMLYARTVSGSHADRGARALLDALPAPRWNAVTRAVREGLLQGRFRLATAAEHQGALQLSRVYCARGRCGECSVGKFLGR